MERSGWEIRWCRISRRRGDSCKSLFLAYLVSDEENEVMDFEPKLSYDELQKAYDELWMTLKHLLHIMLL